MNPLLQIMQPLFAPAFTIWNSPVTWLELVASGFAVLMVVYNIRVNPLAWPLAILSSLLYFALFWNSSLYGEACLQIFFASVALWGWWQWLCGTSSEGGALRVRWLLPRGRWMLLAALLVAWPITGFFLRHRTNTDVPWWDAFPTTASIIGQWLLGRKYVETWGVWVVVNVVSVALFAYKGLWLTVLLYMLFTVMSVRGWRAWVRLVTP